MVILIMGVTGAGKTTVGTLLGKRLGWEYIDADDFHTPANKQKMHEGIPLTDADRMPWLQAIHDEMLRRTGRGESVVVGCSALRQRYRDILFAGLPIALVFLRGTRDELLRNLSTRVGHYAGESLVPSQLATLEEPHDALVEEISRTPEEIVADIRAKLKLG